MPISELRLFALKSFPEVGASDDLCQIIGDALDNMSEPLESGDVLVVAQKIVSKAENRFVDLKTVTPSNQADELAARVNKDPRLIEVILGESTQILREREGLVVSEHNLGIVNANAGVDQSNVHQTDDDIVLLLPIDPDRSAQQLRAGLGERYDVDVGVIINDTAGRAWRNGIIGFAIGVAGLPAINDLRGTQDRFGRTLRATQVAVADEAAAAASLLQGQGAEGQPVIVIRGLAFEAPAGTARDLIRDEADDLFR